MHRILRRGARPAASLGAALAVLAVVGLVKLAGPMAGPPPALQPAAVLDPTATAYQRESIRAMTWNVCNDAGGMRGTDSFCPWRNRPQSKAETIAGIAHARGLNALLLQEICFPADSAHTDDGSLLGSLMGLLGPGWTYAAVDRWRSSAETVADAPCRDGLVGTLGSAIVVHGTITSTSHPALLVPGDPVYYPDSGTVLGSSKPLLCAKVRGWDTTVCTVHLPHRDGHNDEYARQVASLTDKVSAMGPLLLGGDFNSSPSTPNPLTPLYDRYAECDQQAYVPGDAVNEVTHYNSPDGSTPPKPPTKLDYLFSTAGFAACDALTEYADTTGNAVSEGDPNGFSDHAPMIGYTRGQAVTWNFGDGSGPDTVDASGNSYTGHLKGGTTWIPARGGALHFDGTGMVVGAKDRGSLVPTRASLTVSAWARLASGAPTGTVLSERGEEINGVTLGYSKPDNAWQFVMPVSDATSARTDRVTAPATAGVWTHLVGTYDAGAGKLQLYVDGKLAASAGHTSRWTADGAWTVGADTQDNPDKAVTSGFVGDVDDARAYAYALTATEVGKLTADQTPQPQLPTMNTTVPASTGPADPGCSQDKSTWGTVATRTPKLSAKVTHADPTAQVYAEFSLWQSVETGPNVQVFGIGDAAGRSTPVTGSGTVTVTAPPLTPGVNYGWYVRSADGRTFSEKTVVCHFRVE
ncbi:LamG-like jellyroll fold domain-containing protein [Krasilnikovia sp. MM14-A1259]|uniref:LamG-like jellyroll fold domain-containing protein n=1 Tax=Krasilnikovia sp. MM14-A1259 TaxID=3373539 RepID=UPI0038135AE3